MAGVVVQLPRRRLLLCDGCRRVVPEVATVTLDLPDGSWVYVCSSCYAGEMSIVWRSIPMYWTGECWVVAE